MYDSLKYKETVIGHKDFVIYRNDSSEYKVENVFGHTYDLVFYTRTDAINWINSVS